MFSVFSEQPCSGEAREGHCSRKPSHPIGSLWTVSRKGKRKVLMLPEALMTSVVSHAGGVIGGFPFLSDFRVGLDRDSGKSQSANRENDDCHSKFHSIFNCAQFITTCQLYIWHCLFSVLCQFNRRRVLDSDDDDY